MLFSMTVPWVMVVNGIQFIWGPIAVDIFGLLMWCWVWKHMKNKMIKQCYIIEDSKKNYLYFGTKKLGSNKIIRGPCIGHKDTFEYAGLQQFDRYVSRNNGPARHTGSFVKLEFYSKENRLPFRLENPTFAYNDARIMIDNINKQYGNIDNNNIDNEGNSYNDLTNACNETGRQCN